MAGLVVASLSVAAPANAALPSCLNYEHQEKWGKVNVDLRPSPSGAFGTLTVWWRVEPPSARPGRYDWTHFVNGRSVRGPEWAVKDDAVHTVLRQTEDGKVNWNFGDTYKFQGIHYAPAEKQTYVAAVNECVIRQW